MNQPVDARGRGTMYSSLASCLAQTWRKEGAAALWKGFWPYYVRNGPHTVITFMVIEQLRSWSAKH